MQHDNYRPILSAAYLLYFLGLYISFSSEIETATVEDNSFFSLNLMVSPDQRETSEIHYFYLEIIELTDP